MQSRVMLTLPSCLQKRKEVPEKLFITPKTVKGKPVIWRFVCSVAQKKLHKFSQRRPKVEHCVGLFCSRVRTLPPLAHLTSHSQRGTEEGLTL